MMPQNGGKAGEMPALGDGRPSSQDFRPLGRRSIGGVETSCRLSSANFD
jgi:hypothetical protein